MKRILVATIGLALAMTTPFTLISAAHAQAEDPESVMRATAAAVNAGDLDRVMSYFADDAMVVNDGTTFTGKDQVRVFIKGALDDHIQTSYVGPLRVEGEKVTWLERDSADSLRQLGIATADSTGEAMVQGGKIKSIIFTTTPESAAQVQAAMSAGGQAGMPKTGAAIRPEVYTLLLIVAGLVVLAGLTVHRRISRSAR